MEKWLNAEGPSGGTPGNISEEWWGGEGKVQETGREEGLTGAQGIGRAAGLEGDWTCKDIAHP